MKNLLLGLAGILLLTGCWPELRQFPISFPDDPRVLHGNWTLNPNIPDYTASFAVDQAAENIVMFPPTGEHRQFSRNAPNEPWTEGADTSFWATTWAIAYDAALDMFVHSDTQHPSALSVRLTDFDGTVTRLRIPDFSHDQRMVLHGRIFAWSDNDATLDWWDIGDLDVMNSLTMPDHPNGITGNGRSIAFWDLDGNTVTVADALNPAVPVELTLPDCVDHSFHRSSADGNWFLTATCDQDVLAYDLRNPGPPAETLDTRAFGGSMARDSAEIVWFDDPSHSIRSVELESGAENELYLFSSEEAAGLPATGEPIYLSRTHNLLVLSGQGQLLALEPGTSNRTELPEHLIGTMQLALQAVRPAGTANFERYAFTGTGEWDGTTYSITGTVHAGSYHYYESAQLRTAMRPAPTRVKLEITASDGALLWEANMESNATDTGALYSGRLDQPEGRSYPVELVR